MDVDATLARKSRPWLVPPGLVKAAASLVIAAAAISYMSKLKAEQLAANSLYPVRLAWRHGTSDVRLQQAIDRDDGKAVTALLTKVAPSAIRDNVVDRLAFNKTVSCLEAFLNAHWDPNGIRHNGQPLLIAASSGQSRAIAVLLRHGGNPNAKDERGHSVLYWACCSIYSGPEIIRRLAGTGANVDTLESFVALSRRATTSPSKGPNIEVRWMKVRPIAIAAERGNISAVRALLHLGARAYSVPGEDLPPIAAAAFGDAYATTKLLIDTKADVDAEGDAFLFVPGRRKRAMVRATALYFNAAIDNPETVKLLLVHGADPLRKGSTGKTPVEVASGDSLPILQQAVAARNKATAAPKS